MELVLATALPAIALPPQLIGPYETAVSGFLPNHPFLDGTGRQASGAVFAAAINANALFEVNGVSVDAPYMDVIIGSGNPVELIARLRRAAADQDGSGSSILPKLGAIAVEASTPALGPPSAS
jgi:hypothetical protein